MPRVAAAAPATPKPQGGDEPRASDSTSRSAYAAGGAMSGAQAVLPAASFNSRWSAFR
jgi:hypothetical protein